MLRVAIVGCGKIADSHASQIQRIKGCEIVGVCDREPLMAKQLFDRFRVRQHFSDLEAMIEQARPDVVHITTPAETHFNLASYCLEQGCHVYVEKPFTLNAAEARILIAQAESRNLRLTVGHDDQFSHVARRMRSLVRSGYLGGPPVHMESIFCYDLSDEAYARALLSDRHHWVRKLPGKLLQNLISHGIARIAEFLTTDSPQVTAYGYVSPFLSRVGESDIIDELRVIISENNQTTAHFVFSSQMRPSLHQFRVYGPRSGLMVDQDQEILLPLRGQRFKSYAEVFLPPVLQSSHLLRNLVHNTRTFLAGDFHMKSGLKCLTESLYDSITNGSEPPIPYAEILRTATIMDAIFEQVDHGRAPAAQRQPAPEALSVQN